jgi:branched-chain amino acid transport system substrate-binding protein
VGEDTYTILGGVFSLHEPFDQALTASTRLAIREINEEGGGVDGKKMGVVFCDVGGYPTVTGDARTAMSDHAMDYLAGTLGVPVVIGPSRSSDALDLINRVLQKDYPTAIISPSATSPALTNQPDRLSPNDPYGLFWRTCPSDTLQGTVLAVDVVAADTTVTKVAVIYVDDLYGDGLSSVFSSAYGVAKTVLIPFDSGGAVTEVASLAAKSGANGVLVIAAQASDTVNILTALSSTPLASAKYFFTGGSKNVATLLDPKLPAAVKTMIEHAKGTAPAPPSGQNYAMFEADLLKDFQIRADAFPFLAEAYDAAYCGGYGILYAQALTPAFDGRNVTDGLAHLSQGATINVGPIDWTAAKEDLTMNNGTINIVGVSGNLDFDAKTGDAPGAIEVWAVNADFSGFTTVSIVNP